MSGNAEPWDFVEATGKTREAAENQKGGEQGRRDASKDLATKEQNYRVELAKEIVKAHSRGTAWTVAQDIARGEPRIAQLRYERDVAKGVLDAAEQAAWRYTADRRDVNEFIMWSRIMAPLGQSAEPDQLPSPIGARRAA